MLNGRGMAASTPKVWMYESTMRSPASFAAAYGVDGVEGCFSSMGTYSAEPYASDEEKWISVP